jgi:hypothetical protein
MNFNGSESEREVFFVEDPIEMNFSGLECERDQGGLQVTCLEPERDQGGSDVAELFAVRNEGKIAFLYINSVCSLSLA